MDQKTQNARTKTSAQKLQRQKMIVVFKKRRSTDTILTKPAKKRVNLRELMRKIAIFDENSRKLLFRLGRPRIGISRKNTFWGWREAPKRFASPILDLEPKNNFREFAGNANFQH